MPLIFGVDLADDGFVGSGASTIVPANRLGQLLVEARLREGADLEELATRSEFTVGELSDFEAGHRVLNDRLVATVTSLYEIDCGPIIPQRAELTIDLNENVLSAAGHALPLQSAAHDHVLERYLSLVYVLRSNQPGSSVPLRDQDVAILAASLAEREELIEEQLLLAMSQDRESVKGLIRWFRQRLWVPGAGALVGAVSIGTLVMVSANGSSATDNSSEPEPEPDIANRPNAPARLLLPTSITAATSIEATAASPAASSTAPPGTAAAGTPQAIGQAAEDLLPFDWQNSLPGWRVVYSGPNAGFRGLTYPYDNTIEMFVRDNDTPESLAGILAHEIGHAIDVTHFGDSERNQWRDARGIDDSQWWPDAYASDFESGAGDFAESFAYWAVGDASSSQIAGTPTSGQLAILSQLVADIV